MAQEIISMYAILDIETTGGKYDEEGITEIAIYQHNGHHVTDQFISLINPQKEIEPFVEKLTGINQNMLRNAPKFYELAKRVVEITEGCILVAHNADFDYRILQTEFRRLGFDFQRKTLCTVTLSKTLLPDQESYSLGKLVKNLGIPIVGQHRAYGDAKATVKLFELLLEKDSQKKIFETHISSKNPNRVPQKYLSLLDKIPAETGVYYIYNNDDSIIYIGIDKNIKKRILHHLTGNQPANKKLQKAMKTVTFALTGSLLIAQLKEQNEIKNNRPILNLDRSKFYHTTGIRIAKIDAYKHLLVEKIQTERKYIEVFNSKKHARIRLRQWVTQFELCYRRTNHPLHGKYALLLEEAKRNGNCSETVTAAIYNDKVKRLEQEMVFQEPNFLIINKGRTSGEYAFVFIENRELQGYGYYELNHQIKNVAAIKKRLITLDPNIDAQSIIKRHLFDKSFLKLIYLDKT